MENLRQHLNSLESFERPCVYASVRQSNFLGGYSGSVFQSALLCLFPVHPSQRSRHFCNMPSSPCRRTLRECMVARERSLLRTSPNDPSQDHFCLAGVIVLKPKPFGMTLFLFNTNRKSDSSLNIFSTLLPSHAALPYSKVAYANLNIHYRFLSCLPDILDAWK